jgi:hypothetical protein
MTQSYEWGKDGLLRSIRVFFEDEKGRRNYTEMAARNHAAGDAPGDGSGFDFTYNPAYPQVLRVSNRGANKAASGEVNVRFKRLDKAGLRLVDASDSILVLLASNPIVNPDAAALLDSPVVTGVAGNPYFNPFVWDGIHYFKFSYDQLGRVETAEEIGADNTVRFAWDGSRLLTVQAYRSDSRSPVYSRSLSYNGNVLNEELVNFRGGTYRIKYKYTGGKLQEAEFDDSGAHDGKGWRVTFQ